MALYPEISQHAVSRMQQRGIPARVVELLERFGTAVRCSGATRIIFDRKAIRRLQHHLGGERGLAVIERWMKVYLVINDQGTLVTVAHQTGRHRRP
ncbi:hypothetical protein [Pannonibacter sp.]|uniref:hypothetical protein n=1 Tax=Pannonibacter sp. TaxID=1906786 RepID=UPI003F72A0D8